MCGGIGGFRTQRGFRVLLGGGHGQPESRVLQGVKARVGGRFQTGGLVDTLRALEEALNDFAGCAVVISHDRWFLDRVATHMLAFEGESELVWFEGNYQDYEADRKRRLGSAADQPHRIKYRKLTR